MNWDEYLMRICVAVSENSKCKSRQIGAILVRDKSIVATGYNGPPRGMHHCGHERYTRDPLLQKRMRAIWDPSFIRRLDEECPRRILDLCSGEGLDLCPAAHAEQNCIANAARLGVATLGCTLYLNTQPPCKNCMGQLVNAGIKEVVALEDKPYDEISGLIAAEGKVRIRLARL